MLRCGRLEGCELLGRDGPGGECGDGNPRSHVHGGVAGHCPSSPEEVISSARRDRAASVRGRVTQSPVSCSRCFTEILFFFPSVPSYPFLCFSSSIFFTLPSIAAVSNTAASRSLLVMVLVTVLVSFLSSAPSPPTATIRQHASVSASLSHRDLVFIPLLLSLPSPSSPPPSQLPLNARSFRSGHRAQPFTHMASHQPQSSLCTRLCPFHR